MWMLELSIGATEVEVVARVGVCCASGGTVVARLLFCEWRVQVMAML